MNNKQIEPKTVKVFDAKALGLLYCPLKDGQR